MTDRKDNKHVYTNREEFERAVENSRLKAKGYATLFMGALLAVVLGTGEVMAHHDKTPPQQPQDKTEIVTPAQPAVPPAP